MPDVNTAVTAAIPAKLKSPQSAAISVAMQTAFVGVSVLGFIRYQILDIGSAPSREKANICLDVAMSWKEVLMSILSSRYEVYRPPTRFIPEIYLTCK
jgi:hypothetical protein